MTGFKKATRGGVDVLVDTTTRVDLVLAARPDHRDRSKSPPSLPRSRPIAPISAARSRPRSSRTCPPATTAASSRCSTWCPAPPAPSRPHSEFFNSQGSLTTQVNGVSRLGNNVQFEGVDNNHRTGLLTMLIPPIEALQNVDVSTSNYEAELGRAGGAVTNVILKSGTNVIHGGAYEFHNNQHLNARETFQPSKPVTTYNYFGGNIGAPIIKNKTFVFGDYLRIADRRGDGYIITVPAGRLPRRRLQQPDRSLVYDPTTGDRITGAGRTPFAGNKIPVRADQPDRRRSCSRSFRCRISTAT